MSLPVARNQPPPCGTACRSNIRASVYCQKGLATALPCALNEPIFYPSSRRGGVARPENIEDLMTRAKNSTVVFLAYRCNPREAITKRPPPSNLN